MKFQHKTNTLQLNPVKFAVMALFGIICPAFASVSYGVSASGQADYTVPTITGGTTGGADSYTTGVFLLETSYSQPANYGGTASTTVGGNNFSASAFVVQQNASYGQLHEAVQAGAKGPISGASATVSGYIAWLDTITFAGAPVGTQVVIELINVYNGSFSITGTTDAATSVAMSAELVNQNGNALLTNKYTTSQAGINVTQTGQLTTTVGSTLTLDESLTEFISGNETFTGSADFSNTDSVYLEILTPGITLVSASGADYVEPIGSVTVTPEASSVALLAMGGMLALGAIWKKRSA